MIKHMIQKAYHHIIVKGLNEVEQNGVIRPISIMECLVLIHSEVSEAVEILRDNKKSLLQEWVDENGKPEGFGFELADIVIRVFALAGYLDIPLEELILRKMAYNETRPHRHGKKV